MKQYNIISLDNNKDKKKLYLALPLQVASKLIIILKYSSLFSFLFFFLFYTQREWVSEWVSEWVRERERERERENGIFSEKIVLQFGLFIGRILGQNWNFGGSLNGVVGAAILKIWSTCFYFVFNF